MARWARLISALHIISWGGWKPRARIIWRFVYSHDWWWHWLVAGTVAGAVVQNSCRWPCPEACTSLQRGGQRVSIPKEKGPGGSHIAFYDVALEVTQHRFYNTLSIKAVTKNHTDSRGGKMDSHFLMGVWRSSGRPCGTGALAVAIYGKWNLRYILRNLPQFGVGSQNWKIHHLVASYIKILMNKTGMPIYYL